MSRIPGAFAVDRIPSGNNIGWNILGDVAFTGASTTNLKALGDGNHTVAGLPITLSGVANVTSLDITNGVGLVFVGGAGPTAIRFRIANMALLPADGAARLYRATVYSTFSGMAGAEDAWVYFMQGAGTLVSGFARAVPNSFTLGGVDLGAWVSTDIMRVTNSFIGTLFEVGATLGSLVKEGIAGSSAGANSIGWTAEVPTFNVELNTGPFNWTITRIVLEYKNAG